MACDALDQSFHEKKYRKEEVGRFTSKNSLQEARPLRFYS